VFYGIGNRLDKFPELLFLLRRVNPLELFEGTADKLTEQSQVTGDDVLDGDLSSIFGIELVTPKPSKAKDSQKAAAMLSSPKDSQANEELKETKKAKTKKPKDCR
jgi:hypothetical protein